MISLSWWEQFIVGAAISLLTLLQSKISNTTELNAIAAAISFLQKLLSGGVGMSASAVASLQTTGTKTT